MHTLRFSKVTHPSRVPRSHAAALALGFTLLAGLACDENAPTETRAPAGRTDGGATGDQAGLAIQGDVVPLAITLPVNQSVAGA